MYVAQSMAVSRSAPSVFIGLLPELPHGNQVYIVTLYLKGVGKFGSFELGEVRGGGTGEES